MIRQRGFSLARRWGLLAHRRAVVGGEDAVSGRWWWDARMICRDTRKRANPAVSEGRQLGALDRGERPTK